MNRIEAEVDLDGRRFHVVLEPVDGGADGVEPASQRWRAVVDGHEYPARLDRSGPDAVATVGARSFPVQPAGDDAVVVDGRELALRIGELHGVAGVEEASDATADQVRSPMSGKLESLHVAAGQAVERDEVLFVLEAMKMHNEVRSPRAGRVATVHAAAGEVVGPDHIVLELEPLEAE